MEVLLSGRGLIISLIFLLLKFSAAVEIPPSVLSYRFTWTKDDKPFDLSDPRITVFNNSGTFKIPNEGHISHFQGKYRCFASNKLGVAMSEEIEFIVPKLEHIKQDERVYMSQKGDLYFANVEEKDSRNDYCCFAAFPKLRTIVQKMPMKLTVNSSNSIKQRKPRLLLPPTESGGGSESSVTILKGDTLLLECFAEGLPTPQIDWKKMGGDLPKGREKKENHDKTLKIENVSYEDKGNYRCTASNFLGTATHDFNVIVQEPPHWTKKPESAVYSTGSNGILLCEAQGEPKPTTKWKVNGSPIENHPFAGDVISPGEVSFTNLHPNHTAVYQCEASNVHGTILANANIDVVDVRPLIQTEDGEDYATVVGYSAFLHCEFFASPEAVVSWQTAEEAKPLEGRRYHIHENGTLQINRTTEEDAGSYSCWVENAIGKTAVTANLDIRNATKLRVSPKNPRIPKFHVLELHCESKCDSHLKDSLKLSWNKDGEAFEINGTEDGRIIIDGANLTISNVTLEDQGIYSCLAQTALDSIADITQVTVLDVPDPPKNLHLSERQNRSVRLTWEAGDDHNSNISEYIVEFEGNKEEPGRWEELTRVQGKETTVLLPLAPYVRYQFRVIALNEVGRSQPSRPSDHHETPPAAPDKNPQNIRVQASQPKEMIIKWEPLKSMEQNGPGLEYRVTWKPQGAPVEWEEETVTNHTLRVMTPTVYAPYDVQVQAINQLGSGPEPQSVTLYSGEDYPDTAPVIHGVDVINSTLVKVTWSTIPKDRVHGRLKGYQINWWKTKSLLDGRTHPKEVNILRCKSIGKISEGVNLTQKNHPVEVLEPGAEHIVRLMTKNWADNDSIFQDVIETRGREYAGLYDDISTQGWFIGLMCAIALLTLILLTVCFVKRNRGGKYSDCIHFAATNTYLYTYCVHLQSDSDEKPLKGSLRSLNRNIQATESADSLVEYGEGEHALFNEDGSFIGAYAGSKEKGSVESNGSSTATFPLRA
ncbi:PREDICTED: neural cell adhesion molecule L1-like protein [Propithecus coquereli]|uniref:neural cell adhesion molecule L1-like protein n=1 Tax=Propithecus coquereli TaxID=379532 RepID=UPI00063F784A|nr:PREDICTED: neural cell adhesion molecule L1-like protein [Propithecus coquereli]